jgi:hypothetical protein
MDMAHDPGGAAVKAQIDPLWFAMMQFRQRKFEECAESCTQLLVRDGRDQVRRRATARRWRRRHNTRRLPPDE